MTVNAQKRKSSDSDTIYYKFKDDGYSPFDRNPDSKLFLKTPSNVTEEVIFDPKTGEYVVTQKMGERNYRPPTRMSLDEYQEYKSEKALNDYWKSKVSEDTEYDQKEEKKDPFKPELKINSEIFDRIFGGNTMNIQPSGSAELILGANIARTWNPLVPARQQTVTTLDFDERIQLNVIGNVGTRVSVGMNYNTESMFSFENRTKLGYTGDEDDIIQSIEAGNVSLPLQGSLITGSQSLFGLKTALKFGKLRVTTVMSRQDGEKQEINVENGAQVQEFEVKADQYEANRHFFVSHFFRDKYEEAVAEPPLVQTQVNITRMEVWVTNTNQNTQSNRNMVAFQDLGTERVETDRRGNPQTRIIYNQNFALTNGRPTPDNNANAIFRSLKDVDQFRNFRTSTNYLQSQGLSSRLDYQRVALARQLSANEYSFHPQLGYISLNQQLNVNQVLAVAYQYTYRGKTYQVGEFSNEVSTDKTLILKMLKSTENNTRIPMWDLMMKNVYSLGAYQIQEAGFELDIWYLSREQGVELPIFPGVTDSKIKGRTITQIVGFDKIGTGAFPTPDGVFDYIPDYTIKPQNGRLYFPLLEPFGYGLRQQFDTPDGSLADKFAFDSLYTDIAANAQVRYPDKNRFSIMGEYRSSQSNTIRLNAFNVPEGSVVVTAGGRILTEGMDYEVNYPLGQVTILNQGILESGQPIKVQLESGSTFGIQTKRLFATRLDYDYSDKLTFGGTFMNLKEIPVTQKINVGNEPMSNTQVGLDINYQDEMPILTKIVDAIPLIDTKEKSTVTASAEVAHLFPGHSKAIGKEGIAYVDDFEGSVSTIDLRSVNSWVLASTPQGQPSIFPEASRFDNLDYGKNRALFNWYNMDPLFFPGAGNQSGATPDHIKGNTEITNNHFQRQILETEVFPTKDLGAFQPQNMATLDLSFYPNERGPYNYDVKSEAGIFAGVEEDGTLKDPDSRWGGIMRSIETQNFDQANVEFIQFWMMDPFAEEGTEGFPDATTNGEFYINLGNISEDVLKDGVAQFENLMPTTEANSSVDLIDEEVSKWGRVPEEGQQSLVTAFDNNEDAREFQDVGFDGLRDEEEREFFTDYLADLANVPLSLNALDQANGDPSSDNYHFYRGDDYDELELTPLERYKRWNNNEGNTPTNAQSTELNSAGYPTAGSTRPDVEDINRDNTLDEDESYFQYKVKISKQDLAPENVGNNYLINVLTTEAKTGDIGDSIKWYQFRIPVAEPDQVIGNISDFTSIRFMRMFMRGFDNPAFLRFARVELVRGEWRRYTESLDSPSLFQNPDDNSSFNVGAVNIEENSDKQPVNYVLPPDITREIDLATANQRQQNEQSMSYTVCDLADGSAKAAFRNIELDARNYGNLELYVHAEAAGVDQGYAIKDGCLTAFVRLGSDFTENYYEYEVPLEITPEGSYNGESEQGQLAVWPEANNIKLNFEELANAKAQRNAESPDIAFGGTGKRYSVPSEFGGTIHIVGNPNFAELRTIMIGVRNPAKNANPDDDGQPKCAEIWFNELRLTDFDTKGGSAAVARVQANLADFATVALTGSISTYNWGSIDTKVAERQLFTATAFDASSNIQMDKFLPKKWGVKLPLFVGYSKNVETPKFDPLSPDILFNDQLGLYPDRGDRDSIRDESIDQTTRRSINLTNIRKERGENAGKARIWDIENWTATLAYSDVEQSDINTEFDNQKTYRGALGYNHSFGSKPIEPFKKIKFLRKKNLQFIRDFNFFLLPQSINFSTDINRNYTERKNRNNFRIPGLDFEPPVYVNRLINWTRNYGINHDFTKSLKMQFSASATAFIEEPFGEEKVEKGTQEYEDYKEQLWKSFKELGTNSMYNHSTNLTYTLPFNKFPFLNFINSQARVNTTFNWMMAPLNNDSLGGVISNTRSSSINGSINMQTLYNKVSFLKKIEQKARRVKRAKQNEKREDLKKDKNLEKGREGLVEKANGEEEAEKEKEKNKKERLTIIDRTFKFLMSTKNITLTYSQNEGITLPGFKGEVQWLGMTDDLLAGGKDNYYGFLFGQQGNWGNGRNFGEYAVDNSLVTQSADQSRPFMQNINKTLQMNATVQPIRDLRIQLTANRDIGDNYSSFFRYYGDDTLQFDRGFNEESAITNRTFSVSTIAIGTAFSKINMDDGFSEETFSRMRQLRGLFSEKLANENVDSDGEHSQDSTDYRFGYGKTQQDVLINSFISAYLGKDANEMDLGEQFLKIPIPNWRVSYNGLTKIDFFKKYFKQFTLNHGYKASYVVNGVISNVDYIDGNGDGRQDYTAGAVDENGDELGLDENGNFLTEFQISNVQLRETFGPLINVDATWLNGLTTRAEITRDRTIDLSIVSAQITEQRSMNYTFGAGYTLKQVKFPFMVGGKKNIKSDLIIRADFTLRDNVTVTRQIVQNQNQATQGIATYSLRTTADYALTQKVTLRAYYNWIRNTPALSIPPQNANIRTGFSIRFTIS